MEHTYIFGKIDATDDGKRSNQVEVTVRLETKPLATKQVGDERETIDCFSVSAEVWDAFHNDIIYGGQCLDSLLEYPELANNASYREIHDMWKKYHLNDMHAGTPRQEKALEEAVANGKLATYGASNYEETCAYLESIDLLEDKEFLVENKDGEPVPYKYGHGWLAQEIPAEDLAVCRAMASGEYEIEPIKKGNKRQVER